MRRHLSWGIFALLCGMTGAAQALEWVQIGHRGGDPVCGDQHTGLNDVRGARFHAWSKLDNSRPEDRVRVQRGSRITLRLLGHGADLAQRASERTRGLSVSLGTRGRYTHQPDASGPMGFVDLKVDVSDNASTGPATVTVSYPLGGRDHVVLQVVRNCESAGRAEAPSPRPEPCFGAAGSQCGEPQGLLNLSALCKDQMCLVNGGSWDHDECCAAHPGGHMCRTDLLDNVGDDGHCRAEWDKALSRVAKLQSWHRRVDFRRFNSSGRVEAALYCAPRGAIVHRDDAGLCCSALGVPREPTRAERNKAAAVGSLALGYTTPGPAQRRGTLPSDTVACR